VADTVKVAIVNDDVQVIVEAEGGYNPDIMADLVSRAVETYQRAFAEDDE
jgi:hypothetical protein